MKGKKILAVTGALLAVVLGTSGLFGCGGRKAKISNESTRLVLSSQELDGVFNPFYSSAAPDSNIVGMTQLGMISSDKEGKPSYGADEACVVLDYDTKESVEGGQKRTTYRFVLKNDIKFSNGSPLTMKDVLFNLYVYLDPMYYGSATVYSTDIVGLKEFRTQQHSESEQDQFNEQFAALADDRMQRLADAFIFVKEKYPAESLTDDKMKTELAAFAKDAAAAVPAYETVPADYELAKTKFNEQLEKTYNYSVGTARDIKFVGANGEVSLTTDTEAFFYNMGFIVWDEKEKEFTYTFGEACKDWSRKRAIEALYSTYVPNDMQSVIYSGDTYYELSTYFANLEKQKYFEGLGDEKITNISGITFANRTAGTTVNGVEYAVPTYNDDGSVKTGNEVLQIVINDVDPKAIWNFAFSVAPMYYYSNAEEIAKFDYENHFGVRYGDVTFMDEVIKDPTKIGVPVGAGPYKATTQTGDSANVDATSFKSHNVVYFERNDHFLFDVKIKYVNYQVVSTNLQLESLYSGGVHFVEPSCKQDIINDLGKHKRDGYSYNTVMTNGYGYIGINAEKVPNLDVRRAIMHAVNTQLCVDYYFGYSFFISRPMTKASWAYPGESDAAGQYYKFDATGETSRKLVADAGYVKNAKGVLYHPSTGDTLDYVFTIAGDTMDHPAYNALKQASEILNKIGIKVEVKTDLNALKKLSNGDLTVWAAAWGASVDPDMFQVYHKNSTAGSVNNWGYRAIKKNPGGKYNRELDMVNALSDIIDEARETLDEKVRKEKYAAALDKVMELAVELPAYQRSDLFAYNTKIIDESTLTPKSELTPYNGPMARIWEIGLKESK